MLRLSQADRAKFLKLPNAKMFEPMPGRPMKEYVKIPDEMLARTAVVNKWLKASMVYAAYHSTEN